MYTKHTYTYMLFMHVNGSTDTDYIFYFTSLWSQLDFGNDKDLKSEKGTEQ